jgi:hypothetical protein
LIENGAQYIFVKGIPLLGCSPSILTIQSSLIKEDYDENNCLISYNQLSQNHNALLQETLKQLRIQYPQVTLVYGYYYNIAFEILNNHPAYGMYNNSLLLLLLLLYIEWLGREMLSSYLISNFPSNVFNDI